MLNGSLRRARLRARFVLLAAVIVAPCASAYSVSLVDGSSGSLVRWASASLDYRLQSAGSADIVDGSELEAVRAGWKAWQNVACSALTFTEGPVTQNKNTMAVGAGPNGDNEITWAEGSEWQLGQYVLGVTNTSYSVPDGTISEADIAFNGYQNSWSTNGKFNTIDVLNVAIHEEGHFFGAQHVLGGYDSNDPPTMATTADPDLKTQTLEPDDTACACFLYPQGAFTCASNSDCPLVVAVNSQGEEFYAGQLSCSSGKCGGVSTQLPQGTGALGETCASDYDCASPLYCQPTGTSSSVCAKDCTTNAQCGAGFDCFPFSNAPGGVCLSNGGGTGGTDGTVATKAPGEACDYSSDCSTGLCVGSMSSSAGYCRESCTPGSGSCGSGQECTPLQSSGFGACVPTTGGSATSPAGTPCTSPSDCISGLCAGDLDGAYACRDACDTSLDNCPEGLACYGLNGGGGACFPAETTTGGSTTLGGGCDTSDQCASGLCITLTGITGAFCTAACSSSAPCPCGLECVAVSGGEAYCAPGTKSGCVPSGNACQAASECVSQACIGGICRDGCTLGQPGCPSGQSCRRATPGSSVGICEASGPADIDTACQADADCQTNLCELSQCRQPCVPGSSGCGVGLGCHEPAGAQAPFCVDETTSGTDAGGGTGSTDGVGTTDGGSDGTDGAGASDGTPVSDSSGGTKTSTSGGRSGCGVGPAQPASWGAIGLAAVVVGLALTRIGRRRVAKL